jgi:hypothetical protein
MIFELSERFNTNRDSSVITGILEEKFNKISVTYRKDNELIVRSIRASLGSTYRSDFTKINLIKKEYGYLCTADVTYRPSIICIILFLLGLFTGGVFSLIPVFFYLTQKRAVASVIETVLKRVKDEIE